MAAHLILLSLTAPLLAHAYPNGAPNARLPTLGWSSWIALGPAGSPPVFDFCDEASVKASADAFIALGLYDAGYRHFHLQVPRRGAARRARAWRGRKRRAAREARARGGGLLKRSLRRKGAALTMPRTLRAHAPSFSTILCARSEMTAGRRQSATRTTTPTPSSTTSRAFDAAAHAWPPLSRTPLPARPCRTRGRFSLARR